MRAKRVALTAGAGLIALLLIALAGSACASFGTAPKGARRARMEASPQWKDGRFVCPQPPRISYLDATSAFLFDGSSNVDPSSPLPGVTRARGSFDAPPTTGLRVTWLGHSTTLVEVDGYRILTDPIWSDRASPVSWAGPKRYQPPLIALADLPHIDVVIIGHDHYDHLDANTIQAMKDWDTTFVVPLGIGAHLAGWGVPESHIVELDWWESAHVRTLEIVATPSRHESGRVLWDGSRTLWASFAILGPEHRAFFSGDTGMFPAFRDIGDRFGPFDLTMLDTGQYNPTWPDFHMGPEQAVRAHQMLRGRVMLPVHWGLFTLASHAWTEPIERVLAAASASGQTVIAPKPGESVEPLAAPALERWWPTVPWKTGAESPVVSTGLP